MTALPRFLAFYAALFAAFGVASPFLPGLLQQDGLSSSQLGIVLAAGTAIRLAAGPLGGRLADRTGRAPLVLAGFTAAAAVLAMAYGPSRGMALLLLVSVAHAAVLTPLTPVADALALGSAQVGAGFRYGWVRGAGSAAFIAGTLLSGQMVGRWGLGVIVWLECRAAGRRGGPGLAVAQPGRRHGGFGPCRGGRGLDAAVHPGLRLADGNRGADRRQPRLHDGFEVVRWRAAGLSAGQSSVLWSLSVAAEVVVFVFIGPKLLDRLGPARAMALSAMAGVVRWGTAAQTAWFPAMAPVEPLHGLTFALLHLACMDVIRRAVPRPLAATAQAFYATVAMGVAAAAVTLVSGPLYGWLGAASFWFMAGLCALALLVAVGLRATSHKLAKAPGPIAT